VAVADHLIDKSALARTGLPQVSAVLRPLVAAGRTAICGMSALELGFSARSAADHAQVRAGMGAHEWLLTEDQDFRRAFDVQEELARRGRHRAVPLPDLLLAAVAERHRVTVLHYDADFDVVAETTGQPVRWIVPRGSVT
jgi:predicted nucleic acid-binding protein